MTAIRCSVFRGGTSKGLYFLAADLPSDVDTRDRVLLVAMGSPDPRQIDGMGGAHPLTSKVAVLRRSARDDADVDYLSVRGAALLRTARLLMRGEVFVPRSVWVGR